MKTHNLQSHNGLNNKKWISVCNFSNSSPISPIAICYLMRSQILQWLLQLRKMDNWHTLVSSSSFSLRALTSTWTPSIFQEALEPGQQSSALSCDEVAVKPTRSTGASGVALCVSATGREWRGQQSYPPSDRKVVDAETIRRKLGKTNKNHTCRYALFCQKSLRAQLITV